MENSEKKTYEELLQEIASLKEDVMALKQDNLRLEEKLRRAMRRIFGSNSEHVARDGDLAEQLSFLFNEPEVTADEEKTVTVKEHQRKERKSGSLEDILPEDAPVTVVEHHPEETKCPECGSEMVPIGKEVQRTLILVPAHYEVREDRYYKYACMNCKENETSTPITEAARQPSLIPGGYASAEAVAEIAFEKFVMATPLYRQEQEWNRQGLKLSRQTMSNWLLMCAKQYLEPIREELHRRLLKQDIVHADETPVQVLQEPGKKATSKSYMWLYMTGRHAEEQIVLYHYNSSRSAAEPIKFMEGYRGYFQTDGYAAYKSIPNVTQVGCLAHARRGFTDALNGMRPEERSGTAAEEGFSRIEKILLTDKQFAGLSAEERQQKRAEEVKPLLDELFAWANSTQVLNKSKTGEAVAYVKKQRISFENALKDGRLELTNNRAERSIKPFVMGRKNWLFCNTPSGADAAAVYYSLIETARANGLSPYEYLKYVLKSAPGLDLKKPAALETLMPWNAPAICKAGSAEN